MEILRLTRSPLWTVGTNPLGEFFRKIGQRMQCSIETKEQWEDETLSDWQRSKIRIRPGIQTLEPELDDARAQ
jgi:hypothetical protein